MSEAASNQAPERANPQVSASASGGQTLERLCDSARWMFEAKCAALVLRQRGVDRIIASVGLEPRFRNIEWSVDFAGYDFGDRVLLADARHSEAIQSRLRLLGLVQVGFFLCAPVDVAPDHKLSLVIADPEPGKQPGAHKLQLLDELIDLMRVEFTGLAALLCDPEAHVTAATRLVDAERYVAMSDEPSALLDGNLRFICLNRAFARYIGCTVDSLIGKQPKDIPAFSMADSVEALFRRALETKLSPPDFEVISTRRSGARRILHVSVSPFSPIDATGHFLFINGREVSDFVMREDMLAQRMSEAADARPRPECLAHNYLGELGPA